MIRAIALLAAAAVTLQAQEPRLPSASPQAREPESLIQRARALYATGDHAGSAEAWRSAAEAAPVIRDLALRETARALIAGGAIAPALAALDPLGRDAPPDLLIAAGAACRRAKTFDCAIASYTKARQVSGRTRAGDEAAMGLAAAYEEAGRPGDALRAYLDLHQSFAEAAAFDAADAAIRRLSDGAAPALSEAQYESITRGLVRATAFRRAVDVQRRWLDAFPSTPRAAEIEAAVVNHFYMARANGDARAAAAEFFSRHRGAPEAKDVTITLFRLDVREGLTADVEARGRAIMAGDVAGATPDDRRAAARLLAEYLVSVGQPSAALPVYESLYAMTAGRGARVDVLWRTAIAALRAGQRSRASGALRQVLRLKPDSETERAATFWLAYTQQASGSKDAARTLWTSLVRRFPFSYYGMRAAARLGAPVTAPLLTFPDLSISDAVRAHPDYQAAVLFARAGLQPEAAEYARRLSRAFRRDAAVGLLAARASEAAGDYTSSSSLMASHFGPLLQQPAQGLPDDFWSLAYPRAFWSDVSASATRHGVDPLLMLGLARQESHFNPAARSPVGAVGLFQVMPYTAAELDLSFSSPADMERLVQPDISAELAARLLASLQARYQGALAPTIASYNADKERVQVWWDAAKGLPEELFIDSIPYQQTRAYVRQVLTNYEMYRRSARSASPRK